MRFLTVKIGKSLLKVKDCRGIASLWGLMFDDMKNHDGALLYGHSIWMPFIKRKLKLIFVDMRHKVVGVTNAVPISLDWKTWKIYFSFKAMYCIETKRNIKVKIGSNVRYSKKI